MHSFAEWERQPQIHPDILYLLTPHLQETFLRNLEGTPPDWPALQDRPGEEHGERLFAFNRARDQAREDHPLLRQRIGFFWSGYLRSYHADYGGFVIAMGPEMTETRWGTVRFKPSTLPSTMIAVPQPNELESLIKRRNQEGNLEIKILFVGRLVPEESIMYAFSHEKPSQGMVMPVVEIDQVQYFLLQ